MGKIFISYRRDDSTHITERIYDRLVAEYGNDKVFKDVDSIPHGYDFRNVIRDAVESCEIVLAVIGKEWLTVTDDLGNRRIEDEYDFVRMELDISLERNIRVIPILVDNVNIPKKEELPSSLESLVFRNTLKVRSDPDFNNDIDRLIKSLNFSPNDISKKSIIKLSPFEKIEKPIFKDVEKKGYVKISLIYQGKIYKAEVDFNIKPDDLIREFMDKLALEGEYKIVALTHFSLEENSKWELIVKESSVCVRNFKKL